VGLARALSKLGHCSRSQAAALIAAGRVKLNGRVATNPEQPTSLGADRIEVDGAPVARRPRTYLALNKPRGIVTTASDEHGRDTIYSLLGEGAEWLAPVGRLDKASEGLLLMTNDSEWAARALAPETHLEKTYHVQINRVLDQAGLAALLCGVLSDGEQLSARSARLIRTGQKNAWLEVVLDEGKNRQIRRMLAAMDIEVLRLVRVAIGPLQLGTLAKGASRPLTEEEKRSLDEAMGRPG
jgi:23S rRNA pseudouridine2605 synthase